MVEKNGLWYADEHEADLINDKNGALLDLICLAEGLANTWQLFIDALESFDFEEVESAAKDGFEEYRRTIAAINAVGGLSGDPTKLDTDIGLYIGYSGDRANMIVALSDLRDMSKDGFFEYCIRCLEHYIDPAATGVATIKAERIAAYRTLALAHGRDVPTLDYAQFSAKGTLV